MNAALSVDGRLHWLSDAVVELAAGYTIDDPAGVPAAVVAGARVAVEGGFVHITGPDWAVVQIVSAPAVRRITYQPG